MKLFLLVGVLYPYAVPFAAIAVGALGTIVADLRMDFVAHARLADRPVVRNGEPVVLVRTIDPGTDSVGGSRGVAHPWH